MLLKESTFTKRKFTKMYIYNLIGWMVALSAEMLDTFAAGTYIDTNAVAGIEIATPVEYVFYAITVLFTYSMGIMYTRALGENDHEKSRQIAGMGIIVSAIAGIVLCIIVVSSAEWFVGLYDCSNEIKEYAITFIKRKYLIIPLFFVYSCIYQLVAYDGDETVILLADVELVVACLFFPFYFAKKYGFEGLCLSYIPVYFIGFIIVSCHFFTKRNSISFKAYFNFKELIEIIKLSSPYAMTSIYIAVVDIVFNYIIVQRYGDDALSAYAVVNIIINFGEVLTAAMSGGQMFISIAYGEQCYGSIKRTMKLVFKQVLILSTVFAIALLFVAPYWPEILAIEDPQIAEYAIFAGWVTPLTYIFAGIVYTLISYYPMVEKTLYGNLISMAYMLIGPAVICVPITAKLGFKAMTVGFTLTSLFAVLFLLAFFVIAKKIKDMPLFIPKSDEKECFYDVELSDENIEYLGKQMALDLEKEKIDTDRINQIVVVIEDSLVHILKTNKKKVIAEVCLMINQNHVRVIIKDNGEILKLASDQENAVSSGISAGDYLIKDAYDKTNDIAISFNRNMLYWNL